MKLVEVIKYDKVADKAVLLVEYPSFLRRLFNIPLRQEKFVGGCTVWHSIPTFNRPGPFKESELSSMLERLKYEGKV